MTDIKSMTKDELKNLMTELERETFSGKADLQLVT